MDPGAPQMQRNAPCQVCPARHKLSTTANCVRSESVCELDLCLLLNICSLTLTWMYFAASNYCTYITYVNRGSCRDIWNSTATERPIFSLFRGLFQKNEDLQQGTGMSSHLVKWYLRIKGEEDQDLCLVIVPLRVRVSCVEVTWSISSFSGQGGGTLAPS